MKAEEAQAMFGWRFHEVSKELAASLYTLKSGDLLTVRGFATPLERVTFVALWQALMSNAREDEATRLLREFTSRSQH